MNSSKSELNKKQLEQLMSQDENWFCFDCEKTPAQWASINNSIFLCMECSGEHRGFGVNVSYVRSITLDSLNNNQINLLKVGGNKRLRNFLQFYNMPLHLTKKQVYSSKILNYYRRLLKSEANNEYLNIQFPDKRELFDPFTGENTSNNNITNVYENHYSSTGSDNYTSIASKYNNDSRFASVSSAPLDETLSSNSGDSIYSYLSTFYNKTKEVASVIKDKVSDMDLGTTYAYSKSKTIDALKITGSFVYEKGSDLMNSDTVKNIAGGLAEKASSSFDFIKGKITGTNINKSNDDYSPPNVYSEEHNEYTQIDDYKKNSLIDRYNY